MQEIANVKKQLFINKYIMLFPKNGFDSSRKKPCNIICVLNEKCDLI